MKSLQANDVCSWLLDSTLFAELVWPWLGEATGTITGADDGLPIVGALVVVTYGGATPVTRQVTAADGTVSFGGWSGKAKPVRRPQRTDRCPLAVHGF